MKSEKLKLAWVMPICCIYWQVVLKDFVKLFPEIKIFTSKLYLSNWELEKFLEIEVVGKLRTINFKQKNNGYGSKFSYMSPLIILKLFKFNPDIIFADTFCLWTLLILLFKPWGKWKVILVYEGSSPGVDYCHSPIRLFIRRLMVRIGNACITNTQAGKRYLVNTLKACETKVFNYPYFVPDYQLLVNLPKITTIDLLQAIEQKKNYTKLAVVNTLQTEIQPKKTVFLFIGRIIPRKGLKLLLDACVLLTKKQYHNYSLIIVGEGEQQAKLEEFCLSKNLSDYVKWVGQVDYQSIGIYLDQADILVFPSLEDTWGMVVLEAILFGKAVLCSSYAGVAEIIAENNNGFVFEPQNLDQLAQLMINSISNPHLVDLMKEKSQQIATNYAPELSASFFNYTINLVSKR